MKHDAVWCILSALLLLLLLLQLLATASLLQEANGQGQSFQGLSSIRRFGRKGTPICSPDGLQFLLSKNPAATPAEAPWNWDEQHIGAKDPIPITFEGMVKLIRSAPTTSLSTSCGVDNFLETTVEDGDQERIPHGHPALSRPSSWILEHRVHTWPVSAGSALVLRCWGGHKVTAGRHQGTTDWEGHHVSENRGCCAANASSTGHADRVRRHSLLRRIIRN